MVVHGFFEDNCLPIAGGQGRNFTRRILKLLGWYFKVRFLLIVLT
jgi:hypothetical protein